MGGTCSLGMKKRKLVGVFINTRTCMLFISCAHPPPPPETAAKKASNSDAVEEVMTALRRRGPEGLDALVASLEAEEGIHDKLIAKIRAGVCV